MADIKSMLVGVLLFGAIVTGLSVTFGDWYSRAAPSQNVGLSGLVLNNSGANYISNWVNESAATLKSPISNVPLIGTGFIIFQTVIKVIQLAINLPMLVLYPLITDISSILGFPAWFVAFILAVSVLLIIIAVINALKGGAI